MRIIKRAEFLALPAGVVFMKYDCGAFDELGIKHDTTGDDFWCTSLCDPSLEGCGDCGQYLGRLDAMEYDPAESTLLDFKTQGRDALHDRDQLFAVFEQADIDALIAALQQCKGA